MKREPKPKPPPKKPSAAKRTIGLFTGLTDLDSPNARDGQRAPEENRKRPRAPAKRHHWTAMEGSVWLYETRKYDRKTKTHDIVEIGRVCRSPESHRFMAYAGTELLGYFDTMVEASQRCEVHFK